MTIRSL